MNCVRIAVLLLVTLVPGTWANTAAPVLTLDPVMTKGAPAALVTIVEFSDYQ
jgi:hypothetical protein